MRLDIFLYSKGLAKSRSQAVMLIENGITVKGKTVNKPSFQIDENEDAGCIVISNPLKYVSRGGLKLEKALDCFSVDVKDKVILDLGSSTGGFTDCLLQRGASKVYCVDVGTSQLDESLKSDKEHVVCMENTDARSLKSGNFGFKFDLVTSDLSFISQSKVYPNVSELLSDEGFFISLIKPQFELDRNALSKKGIVLDKKNHFKAVKGLFDMAEINGLYPLNLCKSPILGGSGNTEYLAIFSKKKTSGISDDLIKNIIYN